jgi:hypothetical protein
MSIGNVQSRPTQCAAPVVQSSDQKSRVEDNKTQSSLSSNLIGESSNNTIFQQVKTFLIDLWNWFKSFFSSTYTREVLSSEALGQRIVRIQNQAVNGYVTFGQAPRENPDTFFLSPHFPCAIQIAGVEDLTFNSAYIALQASMFKNDREILEEYATLDAGQHGECRAKTRGIVERAQKDSAYALKVYGTPYAEAQEKWGPNFCNDEQALEILRYKFNTVPGLKELLLATGDAYLSLLKSKEQFWGHSIQCGKAVGENHLGKLLMRVRSDLGGSSLAKSSESAYAESLRHQRDC